MDLATVIQNINWLAVFVAAVSTFIIGGIWYSPFLFEKGWMGSNNFTSEELKKRNMPLVFGLTFIFSLIMSLNLAMFIGNEGIAFGTMAGFMTGLGWVFFAFAIIALFENRSLKYVLINGGYMVVSFTVMGAILGFWK
jgi:hypothetical protein